MDHRPELSSGRSYRKSRGPGGCMNTTAPRKGIGSAELVGTPSHLLRRCNQYFGDLFAQESGDKDLTKQQYLVLTALDAGTVTPPSNSH